MTEQMPEKVWVWKRKNKQLGADEHKPPFGIPLAPNTPYSQYVREDIYKAVIAERDYFKYQMVDIRGAIRPIIANAPQILELASGELPK